MTIALLFFTGIPLLLFLIALIFTSRYYCDKYTTLYYQSREGNVNFKMILQVYNAILIIFCFHFIFFSLIMTVPSLFPHKIEDLKGESLYGMDYLEVRFLNPYSILYILIVMLFLGINGIVYCIYKKFIKK